MFEFVTLDFAVSTIMSVISSIVFLYCFISLKRSSKSPGLEHLSKFSIAFLCYFIGDLLTYISFIPAALLAGEVGSPYFELYLNAPYYILSAIALVFLISGAKQFKIVRTA